MFNLVLTTANTSDEDRKELEQKYGGDQKYGAYVIPMFYDELENGYRKVLFSVVGIKKLNPKSAVLIGELNVTLASRLMKRQYGIVSAPNLGNDLYTYAYQNITIEKREDQPIPQSLIEEMSYLVHDDNSRVDYKKGIVKALCLADGIAVIQITGVINTRRYFVMSIEKLDGKWTSNPAIFPASVKHGLI